MSDRHIAYTVVLKSEIKDEDAEKIKNAIGMIKGVFSVAPVVANAEFYICREQVKYELRKRLWEALD